MDQITFTDSDGEEVTVKVGDFVGFKCDIEQSAEVVKIEPHDTHGAKFTVKAPPDGFAGHYIGRNDFHEVYGSEVWTR